VAKVRVHELAKELGITSKDAVAKLQELGEFVRSASSTIEAPVVKKLRDAYPAAPAKNASPAPAAKAAPKPAAAPTPGPKTEAKPAAAQPAAPSAPAAPAAPAAQAPAPAAVTAERPIAERNKVVIVTHSSLGTHRVSIRFLTRFQVGRLVLQTPGRPQRALLPLSGVRRRPFRLTR
jgi:uncharacterized membrane protein